MENNLKLLYNATRQLNLSADDHQKLAVAYSLLLPIVQEADKPKEEETKKT